MLVSVFQDFIHLVFPKICACCDQALEKGENCICTLCRSELPLTQDYSMPNNKTKKVFYGRLPIDKASSLLYYEKGGIVQHLMHDLKYRGHQEIGEVLGNWHGQLLLDEGWQQQIDVVIPVPIHKQRLRERGYNQTHLYAKAFAHQLQADYVKDELLRRNTRRTQVFKNRVARTKVTQSDFYLASEISNHRLNNKHILLVDDIITTGSTLEACGSELLKISDVKISLATMAITI